MVVLEITAFVVGLLGPLQQAVECGTKLKRRFNAFRQNKDIVSELCEDYHTVAENLHALQQGYGGQSIHIEGFHGVIFEQQLRKLEGAVGRAKKYLRRMLEDLSQKNRVILFLSATSTNEMLSKLKEDARESIDVMMTIAGFLQLSRVIESARGKQEREISEQIERFEENSRACQEQGITRIVDKIDIDCTQIRRLIVDARFDHMRPPHELFLEQRFTTVEFVRTSSWLSVYPFHFGFGPWRKGGERGKFTVWHRNTWLKNWCMINPVQSMPLPPVLHTMLPSSYPPRSDEREIAPHVLEAEEMVKDFRSGVYILHAENLDDCNTAQVIAGFVEMSGGKHLAREIRAEKLSMVALGKGMKWFEGKDCLFVVLLHQDSDVNCGVPSNVVDLARLQECSPQSLFFVGYGTILRFIEFPHSNLATTGDSIMHE